MSNAYWALFEVGKEIVDWGISAFPNGLPIKSLRQRYAECQPLADRLVIAADRAIFETAPTGTSRNEIVASVGELRSHCQDLMRFCPGPDQGISEERISQIIVAANGPLEHVRILAGSFDHEAGKSGQNADKSRSAKARRPKKSKNEGVVEFARKRIANGDKYARIAAVWNDQKGENRTAASIQKAVKRADKNGQ